MPRNILEIIYSVSIDSIFAAEQNLAKIAQTSKGFAPMLTEILEDYIEQNAGTGVPSRIKRVKAAKQMLGKREG